MKRHLSNILLCTLWFSLSLCTSCNVDDIEEPCAGNMESMIVTLSLDVKSQSGTRASADGYTWGGDYPFVVGENAESYIDPNSILVFAYKNDGTFVAQLPILLNTTDTDGKVSLLCSFPLSSPYKTGDYYKFMVVANSVSAGYGMSYGSDGRPLMEGLVFAAPFNKAIPMWGVKSYQIPTTTDNVIDIKEISLLRATAKIGVRLADKLVEEGYSIDGFTLNHANGTGYSVPSRWDEVSGTNLLGHEETFNPKSGIQIKDVPVSTMSMNNQGSFYIYVPETENSSEQELAIAVTLKKDDESIIFPYENGIRFREYENGKPTGDMFNIVRNHFYDYTITEVNVGLKMSLVVADWVDEPVWELDFSVPIHTKLMTAPATDADAPTAAPTMYFDNNDASYEAGAFVGYFMMNSPAGTTWRPTLANASAADYEVRIYEQHESGSYIVPVDMQDGKYAIEAADNKFYKIVVVPKNPNNSGNIVKLGLTYTADWNQNANPLLIINKGDNNGLYYPWQPDVADKAGDTPDIHWISIRQIEKPVENDGPENVPENEPENEPESEPENEPGN